MISIKDQEKMAVNNPPMNSPAVEIMHPQHLRIDPAGFPPIMISVFSEQQQQHFSTSAFGLQISPVHLETHEHISSQQPCGAHKY